VVAAPAPWKSAKEPALSEVEGSGAPRFKSNRRNKWRATRPPVGGLGIHISGPNGLGVGNPISRKGGETWGTAEARGGCARPLEKRQGAGHPGLNQTLGIRGGPPAPPTVLPRSRGIPRLAKAARHGAPIVNLGAGGQGQRQSQRRRRGRDPSTALSSAASANSALLWGGVKGCWWSVDIPSEADYTARLKPCPPTVQSRTGSWNPTLSQSARKDGAPIGGLGIRISTPAGQRCGIPRVAKAALRGASAR